MVDADRDGTLTFVRDGEQQTRSADLIVGADGARSRVLARVSTGATVPAFAGAVAWRAVAPTPAGTSPELGITWSGGKAFGIVPLADDPRHRRLNRSAHRGSRGPRSRYRSWFHTPPGSPPHRSVRLEPRKPHVNRIPDNPPGTVRTVPQLPAGLADVFCSGFVDTGRLRLHAVTGGTGPALLLLAGWPQTWYAWRHVMPALAARFSVVAADARGVGASDKPDSGYDTATLARDMVEMMAALGHERFSMVGHDIGMWTAYALAADHPGVVERLAVVEAAIPGLTPSAPIFSGVQVNEKLWHFGFNRLPVLNEVLVRGRELEFFSEQFRTKASTPTAIPEYAVAEYVDAIIRDPAALHTSFEPYRALEETMLQNQLRQHHHLTLPILAIGGARGLGEGVGETMRLAAEDVSTVTIPDAGHYPAEENPRAMLEVLRQFL
ncbi:alpha/beta fold hydrolase [Streptomyces sp. NPDC005574]|uniref:alpha/beta fold hydrolase n=1 Tax=Streptomyces sp. NPDC005574 TaxID=3156891 RepID=UPI0033B33042